MMKLDKENENENIDHGELCETLISDETILMSMIEVCFVNLNGEQTN